MLLRVLLITLGLGLSVGAEAAGPGPEATPAPKPPGTPYEGGGRTGGDTIADAVPIPALPFGDTGNTCGYANDYDEVCPYTGSTSPDVVYSWYSDAYAHVDIDLCASSYDTKVYVYENGPNNLIACNDDASCGYSGWQSQISALSVVPGQTYYIVVDGYGGTCGEYILEVGFIYGGCPAWYCPPGALEENEPDCYDEYEDQFNGGCNSAGWTEIWAQADGQAVMCGKSGTYSYQGTASRDTDWYTVRGSGGPVTMTGCGTFPLAMFFIWGTDCDNLQYDFATAGVLEEAILTRDVASGVEAWLWMGPSVFSGIPCGSRYLLEVEGIEAPPPVPADERSWGSIKATFGR